MTTIETFSNVTEIPLSEARALLREVNKQGITSKVFLKAVNDHGNFTGENFMESFNTWKGKALILLVIRHINRADYYGI